MKRILSIVLIAFLVLLQYACSTKDEEQKTGVVRDSLEYKPVNINRSYGDCADESSNCVSVDISYPEFISQDRDSIVTSINSYIQQSLLYYSYGEVTPTTIDELIQQMINDYKNQQEEFPDYTIGWKESNKISVVFNKEGILSLEFFEFEFMGGAHPNTTVAYENFNTNTGSKIVYSDIFVDGYESTLNKIAEKEFRSVRNIAPDANLDSLGFWFNKNKFELTENFAITDSGLIFFYNNYEIAPYAWGSTKIELSYASIKDIIKPDGILNRIIN